MTAEACSRFFERIVSPESADVGRGGTLGRMRVGMQRGAVAGGFTRALSGWHGNGVRGSLGRDPRSAGGGERCGLAFAGGAS